MELNTHTHTQSCFFVFVPTIFMDAKRRAFCLIAANEWLTQTTAVYPFQYIIIINSQWDTEQ